MRLMVYYLVFGHFPRFFFRMHLNPEKRPTGPQESGENPEIFVVDVSLAGAFPAFHAFGWYQ